MASNRGKRPPAEALVDLKRRLALLRPRDPARSQMIEQACNLYGISRATLYRCLGDVSRPKPVRRSDHGVPRDMTPSEMERYCELIAAMKVRTTNKKGRRLSTARAIELLETCGVETPDGLVKVPPGTLRRGKIDRYMRNYGYDTPRISQPMTAVRFQAKRSNELWQFDLSPSDLKEVEAPLWIEEGRGQPKLMLLSVVDDRSGIVYQEYRCVYGEEAEAGLRFLFNAMAPKDDPDNPFQGIPDTIYMDNGPIARSQVFRSVMAALGVRIMTHMPSSKDKRRTTARAKGKVERPFQTIKEAHETLYHFHKPENEAEANLWLHRHFLTYNGQQHRSEPHTRIEDWVAALPENGFREMCAWERFCSFAREPERRTVGVDARLSINGASYEVDHDCAGETVTVFWGLFDQDIYIEFDSKRLGPYRPVGGAIPLWKYRKLKRSNTDERADRIIKLAEKLGLPRSALWGDDGADVVPFPNYRTAQLPRQAFLHSSEQVFAGIIPAKLAIADFLGLPLAKLTDEEREAIDAILAETLNRDAVIEAVRARFRPSSGARPC